MSYGYNTFPFTIESNYTKPDKTDKEKYPTLDELYHVDFAKWAIYNANETRHSDWLKKIYVNKQFYKGDQWTDEDVQSFLMDESGGTKSRIKISINQIRPIVEQYRGNAIRLSVAASAKSISKNVKVRREEELKRQLFLFEVSQEFSDLGNAIRNENPSIADTEEETELLFENVYVDKYEKNINRLIKFSAEYNEMNKMQAKIAENMAFSGKGTIEEYRHGEHLVKEIVQPEEHFWDRNARREDLQDAAYQGRVNMMVSSDIYERWENMSSDAIAAINSYITTDGNVNSTFQSTGSNANSVAVYKVYFLDDMKRTAGYVLDEFEQPYLVYLNEKDEFSNGKIWTEEDLIDPPDNIQNQKIFKGKNKRNVVVSVLRYCSFIPGEAINYSSTAETGSKIPIDIVLDYGIYEYQEYKWGDLSRNLYPFKSWCWSYIDGEVMSPVDDIINPQRFINRIMSALEGQVNNSGGAGIIYDKDMVDDEDEELAILQNSNAGKPIGIRTRGKGVPNTVGIYDNTVKSGTYQMFGLIPVLKQMIQDITGVNEGLKGESTGSDQLVGVTQLLIQKGSLMQEPFYNAIAEVFVQSHQATATIGKKIYMDNQRELNIITGDEGVEVFNISRGMQNEEFRVFITRSMSPEQMQQNADSVLTILLQNKLIDKKVFADMWGRSTVQEIQNRLRREVNKQILAERKQAEEIAQAQQQQSKEQQVQEQQLIEGAQQEKQEDQVLQAAEKQDDHNRDLEKIVLTEQVKAE